MHEHIAGTNTPQPTTHQKFVSNDLEHKFMVLD
jgi:hypothetical protein